MTVECFCVCRCQHSNFKLSLWRIVVSHCVCVSHWPLVTDPTQDWKATTANRPLRSATFSNLPDLQGFCDVSIDLWVFKWAWKFELQNTQLSRQDIWCSSTSSILLSPSDASSLSVFTEASSRKSEWWKGNIQTDRVKWKTLLGWEMSFGCFSSFLHFRPTLLCFHATNHSGCVSGSEHVVTYT